MASLGAELTIDPTDDGFAIAGELDAHTAPRLDDTLSEYLDTHDSVVITMPEVTFMDSSGIRVLIAATNRCRDAGGDLVIVGPSAVVTRLIDVSGLSDHLTVRSAP